MNINNLAQPTNFSCGSDKLSMSSYFLTTVNLPGISIQHPEIGGRSGSALNLNGNRLTFNSLTFGLLVDENFAIYKEFTDKLFTGVSPTSGSFANIEFDFWVEVTNTKGHKIFKVNFENCRVESIGDVEFDTSSSEVEFSLPVEIKYDYYTVEYSSQAPTVLV